MQISVSKKMGDATFSFSIEGSDLKDCLFKSAFLMDKDEVWGAGMESFKGKTVRFNVRKTKDDKIIYVERKCRDDAGRWATSTLGTYKEGGWFWHGWEVYDPSGQTPKSEGADIPANDDF